MKTTRYFREIVARRRPELRCCWFAGIIACPVHSEPQRDGRIRYWGYVDHPTHGRRALRVVTLADGETVHNAFFDRRFRYPTGPKAD